MLTDPTYNNDNEINPSSYDLKMSTEALTEIGKSKNTLQDVYRYFD